MIQGAGGLLVDTGYFFALRNGRDPFHESAKAKQNWLDDLPVILPWPVLYETLNTRFVGRPGAMDWFERLASLPSTELLDDSRYRSACYRNVHATARRGRRLSLVDTVLRAIIEDSNVAVQAMLTFDPGDFADVCRQHSVELL